MRKIFISCLLILLAAGSARAHEHEGASGFGGFSFGVMYYDLSSLNTAIGTTGYEKISSIFKMVGGEGYAEVGKLLIGGGGFAVLPNYSEHRERKITAEITGSFGFFKIGYNAIRKENFLVAPMLGIGGGGMSMYLTREPETTPDFNELLRSPGDTSIISIFGGFSAFGGVVSIFRIPLIERVEKENGATMKSSSDIGGLLKIGYVHTFDSTRFASSGKRIRNAPTLFPGGLLISVSLVFGGRATKIEEK